MDIKNSINYFLHIATEKSTVNRAFFIALIVGLTINILYDPPWSSFFAFNDVFLVQILLSVIVAFAIILLSTIFFKLNLKPGNISHIDALLKCNSCNKTDFHVQKGNKMDT
ncbi:MAG: hypothetical protein ACP5DQ_08850 [Bacteroidales bacterium]